MRWLLLLSLAEIATMLTFSTYTAAQPLLAASFLSLGVAALAGVSLVPRMPTRERLHRSANH